MNTRDPLVQLEVAGANKRYKVEYDPDNPDLPPAWSFVPEKVWNDPNVIVETKEDGHRFKMHVGGTGNRFDSRRESVTDGLYVEKTDNAPHLRDLELPGLTGTVLDGELVAGIDSNDVAHALGSHATEAEKSALEYVVFDILFYKGKDVRGERDEVRRAMLEMMFTSSLACRRGIKLIDRPKRTPSQKKEVLLDVLSKGEEGVMLKDITKPYGKGWMKVKKEARYDVIVTGYAPPKESSKKKGDAEETPTKFFLKGWIGAIKFGQYRDRELVHYGQTSGMDEAVRRDVSENKERYIGRPFEISAQSRFPKSGKFRHPRFIRWRDDKNPEDCIYREDEV